MYDKYWSLTRRPFDATDDPDFYYPGEAHQVALLKLRYAVEQRAGASLLVGESGVGKTLLIQRLREQLAGYFDPVAHLVYPPSGGDPLLAQITEHLTGVATGLETVPAMLERLERSLWAAEQEGRRAVAIIDEAQVIEHPEDLQRLRMLLNFQHGGTPLLSLVVVSQPSFLSALRQTPQFESHFFVKCVLPTFTLNETISYIHHRLAAADAQREIFSATALEAIHHQADGVPRRINRLCDLSLLVGYADQLPIVDADDVLAVASELSFAA